MPPPPPFFAILDSPLKHKYTPLDSLTRCMSSRLRYRRHYVDTLRWFTKKYFYLATFLQDPVDPIPDISGDITQYQISFLTVSTVATENVNIARCTGGRCSHTFEPPSNPPSSYDSVSVAAENVVGVGAARMCTTQPISELRTYIKQ